MNSELRWQVQWNLSKSNLLGTNLYVRNRHVFSLYRSNFKRGLCLMPLSTIFKLTKISYIGNLFKSWFIQDSGLFKVQIRQVWLYIIINSFFVVYCQVWHMYNITFLAKVINLFPITTYTCTSKVHWNSDHFSGFYIKYKKVLKKPLKTGWKALIH